MILRTAANMTAAEATLTGQFMNAATAAGDISDILVFGCGTDTLPVTLKRSYLGAIITGYDLDATKLIRANMVVERIEASQVIKYTSIKPEKKFDAVFSSHCLHHDPEKISEEMVSLVKLNGLICIIDYDMVGMQRHDFFARFGQLPSEGEELRVLGRENTHRLHTSFGLEECTELFEKRNVRHVRSGGKIASIASSPPTEHFYYIGKYNN